MTSEGITKTFVAGIVVLLVCAVSVCTGTQTERQFIWAEANSQVSSAQTTDDYLRAAESYQKLVDSGVRNGPLFHNLGTSLLKAGLYNDAARALMRAERYLGNNWDVRRNLLIAVKGQAGDEEATLPWHRFPLFWHYGLATSTRTAAAVFGFAGVWLALILRRLSVRAPSRQMLGISLLLLVLFGSSAATSIHQETREGRFEIAARSATTFQHPAPSPEAQEPGVETENPDLDSVKEDIP
jgi:hypothetical protein